MKAGDVIKCPVCGERSVVKLKKILSGWQVTGTCFVCALCSAELGRPQEGETPAASGARDKLAALLGEAGDEKISIDPGEDYRRGCRNCTHLLEHPFKLLCALTQQQVDPMFECESFSDRSKEKL